MSGKREQHRIRKLGNFRREYIGHLYNAVPEGLTYHAVSSCLGCILQIEQEGLRLFEYPRDAQNGRTQRQSLDSDISPPGGLRSRR